MPPPRPIRRPVRPANTTTPLPSTTASSTSTAPSSNQTPHFDIRNPSALADDTNGDNAPTDDVDDAFLTADIIGKRGAQVKRNAIEVDGYGSDSSNEGFDGRVQRKQKRKKQEEEEKAADRDMFADLASDDDNPNQQTNDPTTNDGTKKTVRFLAPSEIEGQITTSKSGGHVSADFSLHPHDHDQHQPTAAVSPSPSSSDDDDSPSEPPLTAPPPNEDAAELGAGSLKTHAPRLDAFNMKAEQEEGRFDAAGNYVRKAADADAGFDTWLEGVSRRDMRRAREAAERREEEGKKRRREEDLDGVGVGEVVRGLVGRVGGGGDGVGGVGAVGAEGEGGGGGGEEEGRG